MSTDLIHTYNIVARIDAFILIFTFGKPKKAIDKK